MLKVKLLHYCNNYRQCRVSQQFLFIISQLARVVGFITINIDATANHISSHLGTDTHNVSDCSHQPASWDSHSFSIPLLNHSFLGPNFSSSACETNSPLLPSAQSDAALFLTPAEAEQLLIERQTRSWFTVGEPPLPTRSTSECNMQCNHPLRCRQTEILESCTDIASPNAA